MHKGIVLFSILFITTEVFAQSTCQTRVDAHQKATTPQRVEYCLTQEMDPATAVSQPELVYAQVSSHKPAVEPKQKEYTSSNPYFSEDKYTVMQGYVGTTQFPEFQNATLSEQEINARRKEWLKNQSALERTTYSATPQPVYVTTARPVLTKPALTKPTVSVVETKTGLARRSSKPQRVMKQTVVVEKKEISVSTDDTLEEKETGATPVVKEDEKIPVVAQEKEQPSEDELGLMPDNPYAQPADLTNSDETIPYGEK